MNPLLDAATDLWTRLFVAMRTDGIIAEKQQQAGPATCAVIVSMLQAQPQPAPHEAPWLQMNMVPQSGREVVARDTKGGLHILYYDAEAKSWFKGRARVRADRFDSWRFVDSTGVVG